MKLRVGKAWKSMLLIALATSAVLVIINLIVVGYTAPWTGFGDFIKPNGDIVRGKTLWDWMQLFIIPIFLSIGVFLLNRSERNGERAIAEDRQQETALQTYIDRMSDLLLKNELLTSTNENARDLARIRTLTILRKVDSRRKGLVILFLYESHLINEPPVIDLDRADLTYADLGWMHLPGVNFCGADLRSASLRGTNLRDANLSEAHLGKADLRFAELQNANLSNAIVDGAIVSSLVYNDQTNLAGVDFSKKQFRRFRPLGDVSITGKYKRTINLGERKSTNKIVR